MTKHRALLFDFGGTLDLRSHWLDRFLECYRAAALDLERREFEPAFSHATRLGYSIGSSIESFGLARLVEFLVDGQVEYLKGDGPGRVRLIPEERWTKVAQQVCDRFVTETGEGLRQNRHVLEKLRPRFKLGVVSNWYGNLDAVLAEAGMRSLVDVAVDSTRVGFSKPDPRIFETAIAALAVTAPETVMIGDSVLKDCVPAHRLGMRTVLIRALGNPPVDEDAMRACDHVIDSLDEILTIAW